MGQLYLVTLRLPSKLGVGWKLSKMPTIPCLPTSIPTEIDYS